MTLRELIENKNLEIQAIKFIEKDTFEVEVNMPKKLGELVGLIKSIESNSREYKNWVKENSIFYLEESINNCKKCFNASRINTVTSSFLKDTIKNCKKLSVDAIKNLFETAAFFEIKIACHQDFTTPVPAPL
jgi:predicted alpha/beta hydrolase